MKKLLFALLMVAAFVVAAGEELPRYVFLFIGDGMSTPQRMIASELRGRKEKEIFR